MKKIKAKLIKQLLRDNGIEVDATKRGYRSAKRRYNELSRQSKKRVG